MKMKLTPVLSYFAGLAIFGILGFSSPYSCLASSLGQMAPQNAKELQKWLDLNKEYRMATLEDCNCIEDVKLMRQGDGEVRKPQPAYQPHYAIGDFNGDGVQDFAVIVRPIASEKGALALLFLAQRSAQGVVPIKYPIPDPTIQSYGLFVDRSNKKKARLLVGLFASEDEEVPIPKKQKVLESK